MNLNRVLITGASGFVGCRLAEVMIERRLPVVGMVRSWHKAARLARLPIRMVHGELLDKNSLRDAMRDCDMVFHCAVDSTVQGKPHRRAMIDGTTNVMEAALEANIKRVVYLSSTAVYGFWPTQALVTENTPIRYSGDAYCDGKIDAEEVALRYHRKSGLPVVVLRPSMVYGPYETFWARHLIDCLQRNSFTLVNGGTGICNCLYVDNLVSAIWLASQSEDAIGQVFVISDAEPVKWKEMIEGHAAAIGGVQLPLPDMTAAEIGEARRRHTSSSLHAVVSLVRRPETRQALRTVPVLAWGEGVAKTVLRRLPASIEQRVREVSAASAGQGMRAASSVRVKPQITLSEDDVRFYTCNVVFSTEKARRLLGYDSKITFAEGMRRTADWIRWARL